jgi:hypothetical protein
MAMSGMFTLLEVDSGVDDNSTRAPNIAVEITKGSRLCLEWDAVYARYVISLSKFKMEDQLCFSAKVDIAHVNRLQCALSALVKHIEDNKQYR